MSFQNLRTQPAIIPWSGAQGLATFNISPFVQSRLPIELAKQVPSTIILLFEKEAYEMDLADSFVDWLAVNLYYELKKRLASINYLTDHFFSSEELDSLIIPKQQMDWYLYFNEKGGLQSNYSNYRFGGAKMLPCPSMPNHGMVKMPDDNLFIVTARKPGQLWDGDSDVGHESAHTSFAPIPFFSQVDGHALLDLPDNPYELTPEEIKPLIYTISELAVMAIRGERRKESQTGLPVADTREKLEALIRTWNHLQPLAGFAEITNETRLERPEDYYTIFVPFLRLLPLLRACTTFEEPPTVEWIQSL